MSEMTTVWTAHLRGGEHDGAERPLLSLRGTDVGYPPMFVLATRCDCCDQVIVWEPDQHPNESVLPQDRSTYALLAVEDENEAPYVAIYERTS